ncbi:MAG: hypothetical protein PUF12_07410 [Thermoflexaceae bacterium]|nr:hypothetical protein [Thermoflexaceae bacterium]
MGSLIFLLIIIAIIGDRQNFFSGKQFNTIKKVIKWLIILSIFSGVIPQLLAMTIGLTVVSLPFILPAGILWYIVSSGKKKKKEQENNQRSYNQKNDATGTYYGNSVKKPIKESILPKAASKRRKIIEKFNKKYELYLTESQIQRMVDASYYSPEWEKEIADMDKEYASVYEWFQGNTAWLRAYLKAFKVQSISSDFEQQKQICFSEYDQVLGGVDMAHAYSQEEAVREINDKFFTGFDDISFMIAYRFLEANGRKYDLSHKEVLRNESETDILARKYEQMPSH